MIAMVSDSQLAFDQIGNSLGGPQLSSVSMGHSPLTQETNESFLLFQGQSRWPARCWLGFQRILPTGSQGIAPTHNAAGMATDASGNFMEGELLLQERSHTTSTFFQQFRRSLRSHGDTPLEDVSIILHYLCGSQYFRLQKPTVDIPEWLTHPEPDSGEKVTHELSDCLQPMIQLLPDIYREAVILSELKGLKKKEVALMQGTSLSGAKSRVQRGRALLKEMLADCCRLEFDHNGRLCDYERKGKACDAC